MNMQPAAAPTPNGLPVTPTTTLETSATAFKQVSATQLKCLNDTLFDLVVGAQLHGAKDMSLRELQQAYEARHNKRIELGTVSGAITRMVAAHKLVRNTMPRHRAITGREILPFCAPLKQTNFL